MARKTLPAVPEKSLLAQDTAGRFDVLAAKCARGFVGLIEQRAGVRLWDHGLGEVTESFIKENLPAKKFTASDVARSVGILKPKGRR